MITKHSTTFIIIGVLLFFLVTVFSFTSPEDFFNNVKFVDDDLSRDRGNELTVNVSHDLGDAEELNQFPDRIDRWVGIDKDVGGWKQSLGADTVINRNYIDENPFDPVFLLIMQSSDRTSFHPPTVCYPAIGYTIEEEGKAIVRVTDTSWVAKLYEIDPEKVARWVKGEVSIDCGEISVKKLLVRNGEGERRVVIYFYIKESGINGETIDMVRVSTVAPSSGDYDASLARCQEFMGEVIPLLFEPDKSNRKMFISYMLDMGPGGYFLIVFMFAVPLALVALPVRMKRKAVSS
ncbi:MAG: exosortase-associated EpsI family protein [Dehalococcoidia bacterium]